MKRGGLPRVLTIRPEAPFLSTLVRGLLDGVLVPGFSIEQDILALADIRIFVPTRRSARALRGAFVAELGGRAAILPRIVPIGDVDEETGIADQTLADTDSLPPTISDMERRIGITRLVLSWSRHVAGELFDIHDGRDIAIPASPADAARLADDLIRLMDQVATEQADWTKLFKLVPEDYAQYWQISLEFLKIVTEYWPQYLAERNALDPGMRRNLAIERAADRLADARPETPVVAAGSTGTAPATAKLLRTVAGLPNGAVVLPGLDCTLDDASWEAIGDRADNGAAPSHPQYGMRQLLRTVGVDREDVQVLPPAVDSTGAQRMRVVNEAMRPAETTDGWADVQRFDRPVEAAFNDVALINARNQEEEALSIAIALREAIAEDETAALITPDRPLARRVAAHLHRWQIRVDDSAGRPLAATPPAVLARLVGETALHGFDPVTLLALLKHPLARFGLPRASIRHAAHLMEIAVLRGARPRPGSAGLLDAHASMRAMAAAGAARVHPALARFSDEDWACAEDLIARIADALQPLESLAETAETIPVDTLVRAHAQSLDRVAADEAGKWAGLADTASTTRLLELLRELRDQRETVLAVTASEWPNLFMAWMGGIAVRPNIPADPRISIWGPLEARLQTVGRIVLGGLTEGVWPAATRSDPWLSRPMRHDLGLEAPERRIGLSAHDFVQSFGAKKILLTRALIVDGAPSVASRWLQRLCAVLGESVTDTITTRGERYAEFARRIDGPSGHPRPAPRPEPAPPLEARPKRLSVTEIETLIRDPYAIYARRVLCLEPFDAVGTAPDLAERGTLLHDIFADFVSENGDVHSRQALDRLIEIGVEHFARVQAFPDIHALWWPRFQRIAVRFLDWERQRAADLRQSHTEIRGKLTLPGALGEFILSGRADRIDELSDGRLVVLDYKTGVIASGSQVNALLAPQLPLEAAIARGGGFTDVPGGRSIAEIAYIAVKDSAREPFHNRRAIGDDAEVLADEASNQLTRLIAHYGDPRTGYRSRARPMFQRRYAGAYDHLARVREWSLANGDDE